MNEDGTISVAWDMCRTCGSESQISIYDEEGVEMQLEEKINAYLPITVSPTDDLPLALCKECVNKLESCHQIVTSCIETEARLRQVIKLEETSEQEEEYKEGENTVLSLNGEYVLYGTKTTDDSETVTPVNIFIIRPSQNISDQNQPAKENVHKGNIPKDCHEETDQSIDMFKCAKCNFDSNDQQEYLKHVKKHDKYNQLINSFNCELCNKSLSSRLALTVHLRSHSGERPYQCQYCHRKFSQKPALKYHERRHTGERPFVCSYCGKGFNSKVVQETHERIHTGERPFCCEECGASFRCISNLRQHQAIHSEVRPFICHVCGKHFRRPEKVRIHMRIHTGERPYSCSVCKRAFTQKGDMMKHTVTHNRFKNNGYNQSQSIKIESDETVQLDLSNEAT